MCTCQNEVEEEDKTRCASGYSLGPSSFCKTSATWRLHHLVCHIFTRCTFGKPAKFRTFGFLVDLGDSDIACSADPSSEQQSTRFCPIVASLCEPVPSLPSQRERQYENFAVFSDIRAINGKGGGLGTHEQWHKPWLGPLGRSRPGLGPAAVDCRTALFPQFILSQ